MKKTLKIIGILILTTILLRGFFYRLLIKYDEIGIRNEILITNKTLIEKIESESRNQNLTISKISEIANKITSEELEFTINQTSSNPNHLFRSKKANCIGYSAMFNSISNHIIMKNKLQNKFISLHKVGQLKLLGINIHNYFQNSFFKDHDYNELKNLNSNEVVLIDPSLSDYLWINRISEQ